MKTDSTLIDTHLMHCHVLVTASPRTSLCHHSLAHPRPATGSRKRKSRAERDSLQKRGNHLGIRHGGKSSLKTIFKEEKKKKRKKKQKMGIFMIISWIEVEEHSCFGWLSTFGKQERISTQLPFFSNLLSSSFLLSSSITLLSSSYSS